MRILEIFKHAGYSEAHREVGMGVRPTRYTPVGLGFKGIDAWNAYRNYDVLCSLAI